MSSADRCILVLEDGAVLTGARAGAPGTTAGEVVFSTCMTGYQEMLSDPSYAGQILTLTYPLIGNYGVTSDDLESAGIQVAGFVVKQMCTAPSNWRSRGSLREYLEEAGVVAIEGIDTRELTRRIRVRGVMMGLITTELSSEEALAELGRRPAYGSVNFVRQVTTRETYTWEPERDQARYHVALIDCGVKRNILRMLSSHGVRTTVFPAGASAEEILEHRPDGIAYSPGPGDPEQLGDVVDTARRLVMRGIPTFGICLGNQIIGRAFGAGTFKLPFGHRGGNHPVRDLLSDRVYITSQNHGYAVDPAGLAGTGLEVSSTNLNDGTVEGLSHRELPIFTIQYHPEANPGPRDSAYLFNRFVRMMDEGKGGTSTA